MYQKLAIVPFALVATAFTAEAAPSKKIFAGKYDGITELENVVGDRKFYSPVRFTISKEGKVTGTAYYSATNKLLKVKGSVTKVNVKFNILYTGKMSGTFSDGTKWTATVEAQKGLHAKVIKGKARKGAYTGSVSLTNL